MSTKQQIEKNVKSINAAITPYETGETWIDDLGNKYNIARSPVDWRLIVETNKNTYKSSHK